MAEVSIQRGTYTVPEVAQYLGISRSGAYNLMRAKDFPAFNIGQRRLVTKDAFEKWLAEQQNKPER